MIFFQDLCGFYTYHYTYSIYIMTGNIAMIDLLKHIFVKQYSIWVMFI